MDKEDKHLSGAGLGNVWAKIKAGFLAKTGGTVNGDVSMKHLTLTDTTTSAHISFTGSSAKYIVFPNGQHLNLCPDGTASTTLAYRFTKTAFIPVGTLYLGSTTNRWPGVYAAGIDLSGSASVGTTLTVGGETSLSDHLTLNNAKTVRFKDTGGTVRNVLQLNSSNVLAIGYGTSYNNVGYTNIYGTRVDFTIGQSTLKARIDAQGITSYGGVAAMGIADLSIN